MLNRNARVALAISGCFLFASAPLFRSFYLEMKEEEEEKKEQDGANHAIEQEARMTADPALGTVPRERLMDALRAADDIRQAAASSRNPLSEITWEERGPSNTGGRTRALLSDRRDPSGNTLWAGSTGGGLWKTANALAADPVWERVDDALDNLAIGSIEQSKDDADVLYFGTGEGYFNNDAIRGMGIWKSSNGGATWARLASTAWPEFSFTQKIVCLKNQIVLAATRSGGIMRSGDGGKTWAKVLGKNFAACPTDRAADLQLAADGTLFSAMGIFDKGGIWRSKDGGLTWEKLETGLPVDHFQRIKLASAPSDAGRLYALFSNDSNFDCLGLWRSDDGGDTWQPLPLPKPLGMNNLCRGMAWYALAAAVDPNDRDWLIIGGVDLFETLDGGQNWQPVSQWYGGFGQPFVHADQHEILFLPGSSSTFFVGNDGGVFRGNSSAAGGKPTFKFVANGYNVAQFYGCAISPEAGSPLALAGAQDNGTQLFGQNSQQNPLDTADFTPLPTTTVTGGDGGFCHIDRDQPSIQITSYVFSTVNITADGWATYEVVEVGQGDGGLFINPSAYDDSTNTLFMAYEFNQIALVEDVGGANSPRIVDIDLKNSYVTCLSMLPGQPDCLVLGLSDGSVARLENARSSQPKVVFLKHGTGWPSSIAVAPGDAAHWLLTYSNYGVSSVFETKNAGADWVSIEGNLPDMPVRWAIFSPSSGDAALLATELGVWAADKIDGAATVWQPANGSLANVRTDMLAARPSDGRVIAATHGRGLFETKFFSGENACSQPTAVEVSLLTDSSATLGWWANGLPDSFEVRFRKLGSTDWKSTLCTEFLKTIDNLEAATSYEFRVRTLCPSGRSIWTASHVFSTKKPLPILPPDGLVAEEISDSTAVLSWQKPPAATIFDLRWREKGAADWQFLNKLPATIGFLENLKPARHYECSVRSRGKYGPSDWSPGYFFTTAAGGSACAPPSGIEAVGVGPSFFTARWDGPGPLFQLRWKKERGGDWKLVQTADRSTKLTGLPTGKRVLFQLKTICPGGDGSNWSDMGRVELPSEISCTPTAIGSNEWIQSFQLADFQHISGKDGGYGYFADRPIEVEANRSFDLKIEPGFAGISFSENYAVWLDLNGNGLFDHPAEQVFSKETSKDSVVVGQIFIPENAPPGLTHLRVMMRYSPVSGSCGDIAWGETEDYLVKIEKPSGAAGGFGPATGEIGGSFIDLGDGREAAVFPNPVSDDINIEFPGDGSANLLDLTGRSLASWPLEAGENRFDARFLPRGIYTLVLVGGRLPVAVQVFKG